MPNYWCIIVFLSFCLFAKVPVLQSSCGWKSEIQTQLTNSPITDLATAQLPIVHVKWQIAAEGEEARLVTVLTSPIKLLWTSCQVGELFFLKSSVKEKKSEKKRNVSFERKIVYYRTSLMKALSLGYQQKTLNSDNFIFARSTKSFWVNQNARRKHVTHSWQMRENAAGINSWEALGFNLLDLKLTFVSDWLAWYETHRIMEVCVSICFCTREIGIT